MKGYKLFTPSASHSVVIGTPMALAMGMPVASIMGTKNTCRRHAHAIGHGHYHGLLPWAQKMHVLGVLMPLVMGMPVAFIMGMKKKTLLGCIMEMDIMDTKKTLLI